MVLKGIPVSAGIAIAESYLFQQDNQHLEVKTIESSEKDIELQKLEQSIRSTQDQLITLQEQVRSEVGEEQAAILSAHLAFLEDPAFVGEMKNLISSQLLSVETAVQQVVQQFVTMLESLDDEYMRERAADIRDVGNRILKNVAGESVHSLATISKNVILVADDLTPSDTLQMPREYVKGVLVAKGGATSHAAILARSLGIPAVMGVGEVLFQTIQDGDQLIIDGSSGDILVNPDQDSIFHYGQEAQKEELIKSELEKLRDLPAETADGHRVELVANIGTEQEVEPALGKGAEGIGLFRSEFLFMDREQLPSEEEQFAAYSAVVKGMGGKPVIIRTLDVGGDKHLPYLELPKEMNPFLGWRAIRISLDRQDMFKTQLRAILRASAFGKALIMFPMISHVEQIRKVKSIVEEAKAELSSEGIAYDPAIQIGIMIEIPSACMIADALAKEVQFFSIGTNDLVQYTLAVDRMNEQISSLYNYFHPAVLRLVKLVIDASHRQGIWTGMCGEMAADPLAAELLIGMGLHEFSTNANSLPLVKQRIRNISYAEAKETAQHVLTLDTPEEVESYLRQRMV